MCVKMLGKWNQRPLLYFFVAARGAEMSFALGTWNLKADLCCDQQFVRAET